MPGGGAQREAEVRSILAEAEGVDAAEDQLYGDARGDELPPELRRRETRLARIREARAELERDARERAGTPGAGAGPRAATATAISPGRLPGAGSRPVSRAGSG